MSLELNLFGREETYAKPAAKTQSAVIILLRTCSRFSPSFPKGSRAFVDTQLRLPILSHSFLHLSGAFLYFFGIEFAAGCRGSKDVFSFLLCIEFGCSNVLFYAFLWVIGFHSHIARQKRLSLVSDKGNECSCAPADFEPFPRNPQASFLLPDNNRRPFLFSCHLSFNRPLNGSPNKLLPLSIRQPRYQSVCHLVHGRLCRLPLLSTALHCVSFIAALR